MENIMSFIPDFPGYTIDRSGTVRDAETQEIIECIKSKKHAYYLRNAQGEGQIARLKTLYRQVFNVEFCVDNVESLPGEEWKPIPGTKGKYFASSKGRIKSYHLYEAIIRKQDDNGNGYLKVTIQGKRKYVHSLVALAFLGEPEPGKDTVHHKNANRQDNRIENLCYMSLADNIREAKERQKQKNE